jgi:hypothetical protein
VTGSESERQTESEKKIENESESANEIASAAVTETAILSSGTDCHDEARATANDCCYCCDETKSASDCFCCAQIAPAIESGCASDCRCDAVRVTAIARAGDDCAATTWSPCPPPRRFEFRF